MNVDPSGHFVISLTILLAAAISGAVIGATYGGVTAAANGQNIWAGILVGAGAGALMGVGAAVASAFIVPVIFGTATIGGLSAGASLAIGGSIAFGSGFVTGFAADATLQAVNNNGKINWGDATVTGFQWGAINTLNAFTGGFIGDLNKFGSNFYMGALLNLVYGGYGLLMDIIKYYNSKPQNQAKMLSNYEFAF